MIVKPELKWKNAKIRKIHPDSAILLSKKHKNSFYKSLKSGYKYAQSILSSPVGKHILTVYSLLNAMYDNDRVVATTSLNTLNAILETDKNIKEKQRLTREEYKVFLSFVQNEKIFKILNPTRKGKEALVIELTDPDFLPFFVQEKSNTYIETQRAEALNFIDKLKKEEEGQIDDEEDKLFDFCEESNLDQSLKSIKKQKEKNLNLDHRSQNIEHTSYYLENTTKNIENTPTPTSYSQNALALEKNENEMILLEEGGEKNFNNLILKEEKNEKREEEEEKVLKINIENLQEFEENIKTQIENKRNYEKIKFLYDKGRISVTIDVFDKDIYKNQGKIFETLIASVGIQSLLCVNFDQNVNLNHTRRILMDCLDSLDSLDPNYNPFKTLSVDKVMEEVAARSSASDLTIVNSLEEKKVEICDTKKDKKAVMADNNVYDGEKPSSNLNGWFDEFVESWFDTEEEKQAYRDTMRKIKEQEEAKKKTQNSNQGGGSQKNSNTSDHTFKPSISLGTVKEEMVEVKPLQCVSVSNNTPKPALASQNFTEVSALKNKGQTTSLAKKYYNTISDVIPYDAVVPAINDASNVTEQIFNILGKEKLNKINNLEMLVAVWDVIDINSVNPKDREFLLQKIDHLCNSIFDSADRCGMNISAKVAILLDYVAVLGPIFSCEHISRIVDALFKRLTNSAVHEKIAQIYQHEIKIQFNKNMAAYRKNVNEKKNKF